MSTNTETITYNDNSCDCKDSGPNVWKHFEDIVVSLAKEIAEKNPDLYAEAIKDQIVRRIDCDKRTIGDKPLPVHSRVKLDADKLIVKIEEVLPKNIGRSSLVELQAELRHLENEAKGAIEAYNAQAPKLMEQIAEEVKRAENPTLVEFSVK